MDERHLTHQVVADAVGVSRIAVGKWLRGSCPRVGELLGLAKFFGVSMDWFIADVPAPLKIPSVRPHNPLEMPANWYTWFGPDLEEEVEKLLAKRGLTTITEKDKNVPVLTLAQLRHRLKKATATRGDKKKLAKWLGVPQSSVSAWIAGTKEPRAETTLQLLNWVAEQERKPQQSPSREEPQRGQDPEKGKSETDRSPDRKGGNQKG